MTMILAVLTVALTIYTLLFVAMSGMKKEKLMAWFAIVVLIPIIGPLLYYVIKPNKPV